MCIRLSSARSPLVCWSSSSTTACSARVCFRCLSALSCLLLACSSDSLFLCLLHSVLDIRSLMAIQWACRHSAGAVVCGDGVGRASIVSRYRRILAGHPGAVLLYSAGRLLDVLGAPHCHRLLLFFCWSLLLRRPVSRRAVHRITSHHIQHLVALIILFSFFHRIAGSSAKKKAYEVKAAKVVTVPPPPPSPAMLLNKAAAWLEPAVGSSTNTLSPSPLSPSSSCVTPAQPASYASPLCCSALFSGTHSLMHTYTCTGWRASPLAPLAVLVRTLPTPSDPLLHCQSVMT